MLWAAFRAAPVTADAVIACVLLTILATVAQLYEAEAPHNQTYYPHNVFFFAGVMLLPPVLFAPLVIVPHAVELVFARLVRRKLPFPPLVQAFNVAMYLIAGLTAWWIFDLNPAEVQGALALVMPMFAALAYVALNHLIVGLVLVLINGLTWRESGVLEVELLMTDLALALLGFAVAMLWLINPWFSLPALAPLVLMARALLVPKLKQEAQTDSKTGLLNARYLQQALNEEFERATRSGRPLALIMADLDFLRTVNNTYGHLAGDAALVAVGHAIRGAIRATDHGGRFGGEEFTVVLPDTTVAEAAVVAERIRAAIEATPVSVPLRDEPIFVTMSLGVAERTPNMATVTDLTDAADVAVYEAKRAGRNRVEVATPALLEQARAGLSKAAAS
jgi:diguanylate cyclase (GGDEF)-like protein